MGDKKAERAPSRSDERAALANQKYRDSDVQAREEIILGTIKHRKDGCSRWSQE